MPVEARFNPFARLFWAPIPGEVGSAGTSAHALPFRFSGAVANSMPEEADPAVLPPAIVARARELVALYDITRCVPRPGSHPSSDSNSTGGAPG